ncbi:MAG TPA: cell division protein ZapA [Halothiobacillus sp.]|jgi:cell division protein ZapA|nr:cell division protein ZapA [Halothiobacillus sp.]
MNTAMKPITVRILEKDYKIACPPEEQAILFRTADYVNQAMQQVKKSGQILSTERVAVLAALNIARELIENGNVPNSDVDHTPALIQRIDSALREIERP